MLGIFMVFVAFTRRSAIDATAVVARWFIWNKNFKSDVRLVWNVVCSFADERPMNLLLRTEDFNNCASSAIPVAQVAILE